MNIYNDHLLGAITWDSSRVGYSFRIGNIREKEVMCFIDVVNGWHPALTDPLLNALKRNAYYILANEESLRLFAAKENEYILQNGDSEPIDSIHGFEDFAKLISIDKVVHYTATGETVIFFDSRKAFPSDDELYNYICLQIHSDNSLLYAPYCFD
jgi:hypothetical protein